MFMVVKSGLGLAALHRGVFLNRAESGTEGDLVLRLRLALVSASADPALARSICGDGRRS